MTVVVCDKKDCAHCENGVCDMQEIYFESINGVLTCVDDTEFMEGPDHIVDDKSWVPATDRPTPL